MKDIKRVRALITAVVFVFVFVAACSVYGDVRTAKFTDIDKNWAKQYIISVYNKGLMDGISDTLFKPAENIKNYDAIVSVARMMNYGNANAAADLKKLEDKYKEKILDKFKVPTYARKEVAYCIEKGIITDFDISAFAGKPYATKKDICAYLGRAFNVTTKPEQVSLTFKDSMFIPTMYKPYVDFLIKKGVIAAAGDANGNFNPDSFVARDAFAKMLDVSNNVYQAEKAKTTQGSTTTTPGTTTPGTTTSGSTTAPGNTTTTGGTTTTKPGTTGTTSNPADDPEIKDATLVEAYFDQAMPEFGMISVNVKGTNGTLTKKTYKITESTSCIIDGVKGYYWKLKKDDVLKVYIKGDKVVKLIAESKLKKLTGVLNKVEITDKTVLVIQDDKGEVKKLAVTDKTKIIKDAKQAKLSDLKNGNKLAISYLGDELIEVNADGIVSSVKGVVESIIFSRTAPAKLILTMADGSGQEYYVATDISTDNIIIEGQTAELYELRPGMEVTMDIENEEVVKIVSIASVTTVNVEGTIKYVNTRLGIITIEVYDQKQNKLVEKKVFTANAKIADKKLNALELAQLKKGQKILAIGVEDIDGIAAETIIVGN